MQKKVSFQESKAFVEIFTVEPTGSGSLSGLSFATKDLIDIAGHKTGCGNPTWRDTHPPATVHAVCVEQLLTAGAQCVGKTVTDELAFSLIGENHFYGTPLNPKTPDRVPGGSSSGSASAVACGLVDFAIGTDTGGSVRVPAANCGIWGFRPTHGAISVAGVNPLSPTFDTLGIFASNLEVLTRSASVLLASKIPDQVQLGNIHLIHEAFSLCDVEVQNALQAPLQRLRDSLGDRIRETSMREIDQDETASNDLHNWHEIYRVLQRAEAESCLGSWVAESKPIFGPLIAESFQLIRALDRTILPSILEKRERFFRHVNLFLSSMDLICIPTIPAPAPMKGSILRRDGSRSGYYPRTLSLTSIAGVGKLPQITLPVAESSGLPLGLSLIAHNGEDAFVLAAAREVAEILS
jgi:amidase